ncbi:MAG: helix-turn-helix transcriptional regulator [Planctomycetota bacterium]
MKLSQKIQQLMLQREISSLDELARSTGISKTTLWEMVKGTERGQNPQILTCRRLAQFFEIPLGVLVDDDIDLNEPGQDPDRPILIFRPASAKNRNLGLTLPAGIPVVEVEIPDAELAPPAEDSTLGRSLQKIEQEILELRARIEELSADREPDYEVPPIRAQTAR